MKREYFEKLCDILEGIVSEFEKIEKILHLYLIE
jgi:hypothetical protein